MRGIVDCLCVGYVLKIKLDKVTTIWDMPGDGVEGGRRQYDCWGKSFLILSRSLSHTHKPTFILSLYSLTHSLFSLSLSPLTSYLETQECVLAYL